MNIFHTVKTVSSSFLPLNEKTLIKQKISFGIIQLPQINKNKNIIKAKLLEVTKLNFIKRS